MQKLLISVIGLQCFLLFSLTPAALALSATDHHSYRASITYPDHHKSVFGTTDNQPTTTVTLQPLLVLAYTDDHINQITIDWYNPSGELARHAFTYSVNGVPSTGSIFTPNVAGIWTIKTYFYSTYGGKIIEKDIAVTMVEEQTNNSAFTSLASNDTPAESIFVVPESPVGAVVLLGSSLAALGGFYYFRR